MTLALIGALAACDGGTDSGAAGGDSGGAAGGAGAAEAAVDPGGGCAEPGPLTGDLLAQFPTDQARTIENPVSPWPISSGR